MSVQPKWWKEGTIYQIYPRSFRDSNGDGIGDLPGIIEKLDYLEQLGVDILWLSPIFKSPNDDNGYDISDYRDIMLEFGTMADFDQLLDNVHARGMKLVLDLVANHSSDEHEWFTQSRQSKHNPYRDYYYWRPPGPNGGPPNNWKSFFSGDAWTFDETTGEYYLHLFSKKQPDLNWENPQVRREIYESMRFWFEKGVDGFRMDVITLISKRPGLPDADFSNFWHTAETFYANGPKVHEFLNEMHNQVQRHYDVFSLAEGVGIKPENALEYVGEARRELNMLYHFDILQLTIPDGRFAPPVPFNLQLLKQIIGDWSSVLRNGGWVANALGNHDFARMVSRFGDPQRYWQASAKLLHTFLATLGGTLNLYQGDEIGMTNAHFAHIDEFDDIELRNYFREHAANMDPEKQHAFLLDIQREARDHARTPFQWSAEPQAGFTSGSPWLKVNDNFPTINVAAQEEDPNSILNYVRQLLRFRKAHPLLVYGDYELLWPEHKQVYAYLRTDGAQRLRVLLNFSGKSQTLDARPGELLLSNYPATKSTLAISLKPWEARIERVD